MLYFVELAVVVFTTLTVVILSYYKWCHTYWKRKNLPYITPSIPFGNMDSPLHLKKNLRLQVADWYAELKSKGYKHGGTYFMARPVYIPTDPEYIKNILQKDFDHFVDRGLYYQEKTDPLSANLVTIEGAKWRNLRTKLTPTFTSGKMKMMFSTLLSCGEQLKERIELLATNNEVLDIKETSSCFTTDVIGSVAFGLECNSFKEPDAEFRKYGSKIFQPSMEHFIRHFFAWIAPNLCKFFGMRILSREATSFFFKEIKNVVDYRENNEITRNDFLQLLMELKNKKVEVSGSNFHSLSGGLSIEQIAAQSVLFFVAGFETSSTTMTFCLYELAKHQDVQDKLRNEIIQVIEKSGGKLTYDGIMEMKYMDQVLNETLRIHPPAPALSRICTKEYKVPGTDVVLEKGLQILISTFGIHHDPDYYENPEIFDPDRFSAENKSKLRSHTFMPFGDGPRSCIGLRFGLMQAKIGLATMLGDYRYTLNEKTPETLTFNPKTIILTASEHILLNVQKI